MADIIFKDIIATSVTSADTVMENFYGHNLSKSLSQLNGGMEDLNRDPAWSIGSDHVRRNALSDGTMIGSTGNLDVTQLDGSVVETDANSYKEVPGAALEFYLPYAVSVLMITWQIVIARATLYGVGTTVQLRVRYDGTDQLEQIRPIPANALSSGGNNVRFLHRDRVWSGHLMKTSAAAGWHSAAITVFSNALKARIRVRNMKAIWFK